MHDNNVWSLNRAIFTELLQLYEVRATIVVVQVMVCLCLSVSLSMGNVRKKRRLNKKYYLSNRDKILTQHRLAYRASREVSKETANSAKACYSANPNLASSPGSFA